MASRTAYDYARCCERADIAEIMGPPRSECGRRKKHRWQNECAERESHDEQRQLAAPHTLLDAVREGDARVMQEFLNADPNCIYETDRNDGGNALSYAALGGAYTLFVCRTNALICVGRMDMLMALLGKCRNNPTVINHRDKAGYTPLMHAIVARKWAIVKSLLAREECDVNTRNKSGITAFDLITSVERKCA